MQQALIFIGAAVLLVPLFQKLGMGSVLGYLIAGMLVGPLGLGMAGDSHMVDQLADAGVVLLLFLIGLEIQPRKLWSLRHHLFGLGGIQILLSSALFFIPFKILGFSWAEGFILAFALSLSSTAFALQTLKDRNELNSEHGRAAFAVLLMQDLASIPALALIPALLFKTEMKGNSLISALSAGVVILALLAASRTLIRPLFRFIATTRSRDIFTAMALFIALGAAVTTQAVGLSAALGTFIAGMLLADSEYRHEIEINIEPFKGLFLGLFFISVGMRVEFKALFAHPIWVVTAIVFYLLVKFATAWLSARISGLGRESAKLAALALMQGGEFAFVIFALALQSSLGSSGALPVLSFVVFASMAASPLAYWVYDRWSQSPPEQQTNFDAIDERDHQVIIAGFGRFGQVFGRLLKAQQIGFVAIDHDPNQIELVRRFGNTVYYGDASRRDLLESAGAERAKYFVLAIDDVETSLLTIKTIQAHFSHLTIFARARNRGHAFELKELGVHIIKRELFDSSLAFAGELLAHMGYPKYKVDLIVENFKRHDAIMLEEQFKVHRDDKMFVSVSKQAAAQLASVLQMDSVQTFVAPTEPPRH